MLAVEADSVAARSAGGGNAGDGVGGSVDHQYRTLALIRLVVADEGEGAIGADAQFAWRLANGVAATVWVVRSTTAKKWSWYW